MLVGDVRLRILGSAWGKNVRKGSVAIQGHGAGRLLTGHDLVVAIWCEGRSCLSGV